MAEKTDETSENDPREDEAPTSPDAAALEPPEGTAPTGTPPQATADGDGGEKTYEFHGPRADLEPDLSVFGPPRGAKTDAAPAAAAAGAHTETPADDADDAEADAAAADKADGDDLAFELPASLFSKPPRRRIPWQTALLVGNTLVMSTVAAVLLMRPAVGPSYPGPEGRPHPAAEAPASAPAEPSPQGPLPEPTGAVSWAVAEGHYADEDYGLAIGYYRRLLETSLLQPHEELMSDYFRLRIAQCQVHLDRLPEAHEVLRRLASSRSPVVRGSALYHAAQLNLAQRQYLAARTQAYQALASLGMVEPTADLRTLCDLLAAEAMARKALAFFNRDEELPRRRETEADPFSGLKSEEGLRTLLAAGTQRMADAALGPRLTRADRGGLGRPWTVTSAGAPLEEFLHRLVGDSGLNVRWHEAGDTARQRALTLGLTDVTDVRVVEVACGSLGLVARLTGEEAVVHDLSGRTSTDELRDLVLREAVSSWRRVLLRVPDERRQAYGHFALGLLYEHQNDHASAITEYRLVTEQYPRSPLAPQARLRGAIVRIDFRDFTGAREELVDLLNRHPHFPASDQVYLRLGQATMETGHLDEAITTFKKLFYLELSEESRTGACLGAGTCFYRQGDYESASEWLARYVALARRTKEADGAARGTLLLAQSLNALGRPDEAVAALRKAAELKPEAELATDLLLELARGLAAAKEYTAALAVLHEVTERDVPRTALDRAVLIESRVLRDMNVPEKALRLVRAELRFAATARMKARMAVELARCYADAGDLDAARRIMAEALPKLEPGPEAHEATCELAEFGLRAGYPEQTIGLARKLLALPVSPEVRGRAFEALGQAYVAVRDYERAALAFSGAVPGAKGATGP